MSRSGGLARLEGVTRGRRVLIVSASIGGGHVAAGRALEAAFGAVGQPCLHVDLLDYTSAPFRRVYRDAYTELVRTAPDLIELVGKRLDRKPSEAPSRARRVRARLARLVSYQLPRVLERYGPDLIVHTHFLAPDLLASTRRGVGLRQATVVTDFAAHALWLTRGVERYFVASDEVAVHLRASGVASDRVEVTGIPIDPVYAQLPDRVSARAHFGASSDRDVLLLMASGMARRTLQTLLTDLSALRWPLDAWVVCGRSPDLLDVARDEAERAEGLVRIVPIGFANDVPLRMAASDVVAGKPGGLTASEALAAGLPFAVVDPYPLQEEANAQYLLERGAAVRVEPLTTFAHKLGGLLADPARRERMRSAAREASRPNAAADVVSACERMMRVPA